MDSMDDAARKAAFGSCFLGFLNGRDFTKIERGTLNFLEQFQKEALYMKSIRKALVENGKDLKLEWS